jgi:phosphoribosylformylglycinamidine (FGAM) synthase-like amidotransferase family enzyme
LAHRPGDRLLQFVDGGGLALGFCNGSQGVVRLGLLPRMRASSPKK